MKKIFIIFLSVISLTALAQQKKVAVYVTGPEGIEETTKQIVGSELVAAIVVNEEYNAVERTADFLKELRQEQNYQRSGSVDNQQISALGKQFGVDQVCVANIMSFQGNIYIQARMLDVESATILATAREISALSTLDDIVLTAEKLAHKLVGKKEEVPKTYFKEYSTVLTQNQEDIGIMSIDNTGSATIVTFKIFSNGKSSIRISPDAYIYDKATYKRYKITGANGISTTSYAPIEKGITQFVAYFEKIPTTTTNIDIIEPENNGWRWNNITLRPYGKADYFVFKDEIQQKYTAMQAHENEIKESVANAVSSIEDMIYTIRSYTITVSNYKSSPYKIHFGNNVLGIVNGNSQKVFTVSIDLYGTLTATQNSGYLLFPTVYTYTIPIPNKQSNINIHIK